jgi:glycosyltransferase EpsD
MKILYVATVSNTINAFLVPHIKKLLIEKGNQVDIACNIVQGINPDLIKLGCKIYNIEFQRSPFKKANYKAYIKIKKLIASGEYQLVHTHTPVASFLTRLACRNISNIKVLYTVHGFHFFKGAPLINWLLYYPIEKWLSKYTDCLITINDEDYELAVNKLKARSVKKVPGVGVDLNKFVPQKLEKKKELRKQYGYSDDDFILIYVGELNYNKHQDLLIKVVHVLKNKIPNIKLLLVGDGRLIEDYKQQVINLKLEDYIHFLGYRKDVPNLMAIADVAVSASRREGLPVNVMEAMATGLPLVVTDCRGNRDLVANGENGFVVALDDIDAFADAIEKLYNSQELRTKFGRANLEMIKKYSLENVMRCMEEIYRDYIYDLYDLL